jgi:hypothetical protein
LLPLPHLQSATQFRPGTAAFRLQQEGDTDKQELLIGVLNKAIAVAAAPAAATAAIQYNQQFFKCMTAVMC